MIVVTLIGGLLVTAILLMVVSAVLPDFKVDGIGAALTAALIASVLGFAVVLGVPYLLPHLPKSDWVPAFVTYALSSVTMALGIAFAPGIQAGFLSTIAAAVIVTVAESAVMSVVSLLMVGKPF